MKDIKNKKLTLIHVGKCGGSTIRSVLKLKTDIKFCQIHEDRFINEDDIRSGLKYKFINEEKKVLYNPKLYYLILIRNPIERFISAFKFNYYRLYISKSKKSKLQSNIYEKYNFSLKNMILDLKNNKNIFNGPKNSSNYINHLAEDINYYLGDILNKCTKKDIFGVICTETINDDVNKLFGIELKAHKKNMEKIIFPDNFDYTLDDNTIKILKDYLKKDYDCIDKLYEMKLISNKQYKILSK